MNDTTGPEPHEGAPVADRRLAPTAVRTLAIAGVALLVAFAVTVGQGHTGETAPTPGGAAETLETPAAGEDALYDLAAGLPDGARNVAGAFSTGPDGAVVSAIPEVFASPMVEVPLAGPPWATVTVAGRAVDGWSVVFGMVDGGTYWAAAVNPAARTVELFEVVEGELAWATSLPVEGEVTAEVRVVVRDRLVQVEASGVALPTASVRAGSAMRFGFLGRAEASVPGAAAWSRLEVHADRPLRPPTLPPILGARPADAPAVRTRLGG